MTAEKLRAAATIQYRLPGTSSSSRLEAFRATAQAEAALSRTGDSNARLGGLLVAAQSGDSAAYREFLASALPFIRAVARSRCWSPDMAEDVVQDALLTLHRVRHTYQPGRPVEPWLAAIVARRAVDAMRRRGRQASREVHEAGAYETFADPEAKSSEAGDSAETLARMMAELTPRQKEALDLVKLREMSLAEASAESGQSIPSLKVNIHRAIRKLRLGLGESGRE